ncbi:MAG: glycosyltransferase [Gemmatimonadetes bacterium]|nr:glycosyltransferase [Gemmatimonadota bacterium]
MPLEILDALSDFVGELSLTNWLLYFWPFFLIDFLRYTILDGTVLLHWIRWKGLGRGKVEAARERMFRERPLVSIIAPGKNEGAHLPALARSLQKQTYRRFELIVIDDGSDDATSAICRRLLEQGKIDDYIRHRVRGGKASAANTGLRRARGRYVVHLDADTELDPRALEQVILPFYLEEDVGAVGGDIRVANQSASLATRLQAIEYLKTITVARTVASQLGIMRIVSGAFGAFPRQTLERLKGWDVGPGLDGDITLKIRKLGLKIRHAPDAIAYTNVPVRFKALSRQRYRWYRSMVRFRMRKHRDLLNPVANFRTTDFISSLDNIFFNFVMNLKWWVYAIQLLAFVPRPVWPYLLVINWALYVGANVIQWGLVWAGVGTSLNRRVAALTLYVPIMPIYVGVYLRVIRSYSQLMEIFTRSSYRDPWNPWRVSRAAQRAGM